MKKLRVNNQDYEIETYVVVLNSVGDIVDELDNITQGEVYPNYTLKWAAAEVIDDNGNINHSVYGDTERQAVANLKKVLL